ncbi:imidazoleglycerol-phosphate dehydratase [Neokomagataea thailandica NBRC 106555]|uniref:Imidazoleglycerol-phosphate dehydratase n=2 Tax=Neokomagataea TaxID=1223423 RepID=A0A4Y6V860_9PROT|nr:MULTISPECIES: imidazoleglycerol-phosphate dehydratase HisB [Neokomagataea]QDH25534.1 imidazoleglycerol-phosphate dehydratase HisB [Neokomagataea tanensis]GBR55636.1 imidazoleglycerol-phosphate dehydratase [Neokomagataea thailandica NBRC 106555]
MTDKRHAQLERTTSETEISVKLTIEGEGRADIETGIGFFDHMLTALARHSGMDLTVRAKGDLHIDDHHTVEDVGIVIGQVLRQAVGDKRGIERFGHALVPLDEALCEAVVDISGRPYLAWNVTFTREKIGTMDTELFEEFFRAFAMSAHVALHLTTKSGTNAHHIAESTFKSVARALRMAVARDPRALNSIPSTKGVL